MEAVNCRFELKVGEHGIRAEATVPTGLVPVDAILPVLLNLDGAVVSMAEKRVKEQGLEVSCKAGCGACCRQPVPIGRMEARWLVQVLEEIEPAHRERVLKRFAELQKALEARGLWEGVLAFDELGSEEARNRLGTAYLRARQACPFLEEESCSIHQFRPMACREYLVTSSPEHCENPSPETIRGVKLGVKPSVALYRIEEGRPRYLIMAGALEWVKRHAGEATAERPGPEWLEGFLKDLAGREKSGEC